MLGRNRCVIKGATSPKVMPHDEFIDRIRKSLYFGGDTLDEEMEVSRPLAEYASELFSEPHRGHSLHRLNRVTAGNVHTTPCSLIMALIYLDRLNSSDPGYVRRITPQELFIVSMMISTKFYAGHDEEIYLSDWAEDGSMTEDRLKELELEFLCAINWNIYISNEQFFSKLTNIEKILARREGLRRGWLTYTELVQMLPSFTLIKFLINNITVMAVSYAASVMTIAGAFLLASQIPITSLHRMQRTDKLSSKGVSSSDHIEIMTDNVLPTPQDLLITGEQQSQLKEGRTVNASGNPAQAGIITAITVQTPNATCTGLNVEAELLKLEQQYREDALSEDLRKRNNEFIADPHFDYSRTYENNAQQRGLSMDSHRNWLSLKEEYSDLQGHHGLKSFQMLPPIQRLQGTSWLSFTDCAANFGNCTSSIFWNILAGTAGKSIVRLPPLLWLKFI